MPIPPSSRRLAIFASSCLPLAALVTGCDAERRSARIGDVGSVSSTPTIEIRVRNGAAQRGAFVGGTHIFVLPERGPMFISRRADARRIELAAEIVPGGKPPQVVWAQALPDGTIATYDFRNRQVVVFDTVGGSVVRTTSLQAPMGTPSPIAAFSDGRMVVLRDFLSSPYVQETGEYTDTTVLLPISSDARLTGSVIPVRMAQHFGALDPQRPSDELPPRRASVNVVGGVFDGRARHSITVPLSPTTAFGAAADGFYIGRSDSADVRFLDPTGRELSRFSIGESALPVDTSVKARLRQVAKSDLGISFADLYRRVGIPDQTPRYRQLRADHAGRLWVAVYSLDATEPPRWAVYARDGTRLGVVTLPAGSRLLDASDSELLLAQSDALGGELLRVVTYRLR